MVTPGEFEELWKKYKDTIDKKLVEHSFDNNNFDYSSFNALMYHLDDSYKSLEKGLKGEF